MWLKLSGIRGQARLTPTGFNFSLWGARGEDGGSEVIEGTEKEDAGWEDRENGWEKKR